MLFTVLSRATVLLSLSFAGSAALAHDWSQVLSCESSPVETAALKEAPLGARRVERHVLEVTTKRGPQRFVDQPGRDDMDGLHWRYCGFDRRSRAHLVEKIDDGLYSGSLLLNESGQQVPAGHTVVFSQSGKSFLAIEQDDGVDGEEWTVHDVAGTTIWKGYAGTTAKVGGIETVVSTFEHPAWTRQGKLTAQFTCASSNIRGVVTLEPSATGWSWRGHEKCS